MIHFCFLKAEKNKEGFRPTISMDIDDLGITFQQAMDVCMELNGKETIAAWMTGLSMEEINSKEEDGRQ